jgi:hypothetical protein
VDSPDGGAVTKTRAPCFLRRSNFLSSFI